MNDEKITVSKALIERVLTHGDHLARTGEGLLNALNNKSAAEAAGFKPNTDVVVAHWLGLRSAAYYYDKHAAALKQAMAETKEKDYPERISELHHAFEQERIKKTLDKFKQYANERDTPRKPVKDILSYRCPNCESGLTTMIEEPPSCCPNCGQRLEREAYGNQD